MSVVRDTTTLPIEPVTLEQAKLYVRSDAPEDDALLSRLIVAARQEAENITRRVLAQSKWKVDFCCANRIHLPLVPCPLLESVSVDGNTVSPDLYKFTANCGGVWGECPGFEKLDGFPDGTAHLLVMAGYGEDCPEPIRQWMLTRIATWFEQREALVVGVSVTELGRTFVDSLLDPYILPAGF